MNLDSREFALLGVVAVVSVGVAYLLGKSQHELPNTKREEDLLKEVNDPSIKKAWAILRAEREELLNQLLESDTKAKKVISEIRSEREELLSQLLDKSDRWTLTYFDSKGRAEQLRLLFAECGIPYTDTRVNREQWEKLKPNTPLGALPVLEHNGKAIGESLAQVIYLSKTYDRWPKTVDAEATALTVISATSDLRSLSLQAQFAPDLEKPALIEKLHQTLLAKLPFFEKLLEHGFFTSGRLTAADLVFLGCIGSNSSSYSPC